MSLGGQPLHHAFIILHQVGKASLARMKSTMVHGSYLGMPARTGAAQSHMPTKLLGCCTSPCHPSNPSHPAPLTSGCLLSETTRSLLRPKAKLSICGCKSRQRSTLSAAQTLASSNSPFHDMPGKKNDVVTLLSRPTALASSSTERMSDARGLCIHIVPVMHHQVLLSTHSLHL